MTPYSEIITNHLERSNEVEQSKEQRESRSFVKGLNIIVPATVLYVGKVCGFVESRIFYVWVESWPIRIPFVLFCIRHSDL